VGFDDEGRAWCVEEVYKTREDDAWWAEAIEDLHEYWGIWRVVSDPENAAGIAMVNRKLRARDNRPLLITADKSSMQAGKRKFAMVMHVHNLIGEGKIRFLRDCRKHDRDVYLKSKPGTTYEEMTGYMWAPPRISNRYDMVGGEGPALDVPVKVNDHGIDAMLYLMWAVFEKQVTPPDRVIFETRRPEHILTRDPEFLRLQRMRGLA
jgi:hypothetical protein